MVEKEVSRAVEAFNRGTYKVIIGSTACIGEGLNLQENSSAIHHFDIPFRPSDFIQRNGRIDRQGNSQCAVTLHSYMSAGTPDNYSVSLVQRKANWIDQLLKTKSNVFINPNDENYLDADELLLALTEEWGDSSKAEERRNEIAKAKEIKILEAHNQKRKEQLASLSLHRGSLAAYSGDKGQMAYQNRLRKIVMLERSLKENPTFKEHSLLKTSVPFLYDKERDIIIRMGDIFIYYGEPYEVASLNFKRREFHSRSIWEKNNPSHWGTNMSISDLKFRQASLSVSNYVPQPSKDERRLLKNIHTEDFYGNFNKELQKKYYLLHLDFAFRNGWAPPIFSIGNRGKLSVTGEFPNGYPIPDTDILNPFSLEDIKKIQAAAKIGIETDYKWRLETCRDLFQSCIPELSAILSQAVTMIRN